MAEKCKTNSTEDIMTYKTAIQLHKLYNATNSSLEWISLNVNAILTTRQTAFYHHENK